MRGWRGIAAGALALIALQTLVRDGASGRVAGLAGYPARAAKKFLDPNEPVFRKPNRGGK
jgi:hypothetical protein